MIDLDELRYPVGHFNKLAPRTRAQQLDTLRQLPEQLQTATAGLNNSQLDLPYREDGWNIRQIVHHIADSHANAYIRVKLALTADNPVIKPYDEAAWARLADSRMPIDVSLVMIAAVHARLVALLESLQEEQFARAFVHPERGAMTVETNVALYDWHSQHHLAHITGLRARMGW